MDQIKIGKFIATKRKEKNMTQSNLAEMLGITDRAISKWENGICMPDAGTIPELCKILNVTINDLFSGMVIDMNEYDKKADEHLLELKKINEEMSKRLLLLEIVIGVIVSITLVAMIVIANLVEMPYILKCVLIGIGILVFAVGMFFGLRIEQTAGYYECNKCHHKYVPTYLSVISAMHINRTRYMKCPACGKRSWNKKVISK